MSAGAPYLSERWNVRLFIGLLFVCALTGCSARGYPVTGTVVFKDGTPLEGGRVFFESTKGSEGGSAAIEADGTFEIGRAPNEPGLHAGKYTVFVTPPSAEMVVDPKTGSHSEVKSAIAIAPKYLTGATSEIEVEINPGDNELEIKIDKPAA
jgi:hypothetical protein